jgi:hypothetical protein
MTKDRRRLLQISCKPDLYEEIRSHCADFDVPMAIWARELIKRELLNRKTLTPSAAPPPDRSR